MISHRVIMLCAKTHLVRQRPEIARLIINRQKPVMKLFEGFIGIDICKQIGVKPFGHLLNGDELIGAVVKLMPDRMECFGLLRLDPEISRAGRIEFQFFNNFVRVGTRTNRNPFAPGT